MKEIPLTQGKTALVDDADFERLNAFKWYAAKNGNTFYAVRKQPVKLPDGRTRQETIFMHHEVIGKPQRGYVTDHGDRNGLNNTRENLENVTIQRNAWNTNAKGVTFDRERGKWKAQIMKDYKQHFLGRYHDLQDAINARRAAEQVYFNNF